MTHEAIRKALAAFPKGWHTVFQEVREAEVGVAEIGARDEDDERKLFEAITVDTANYYDGTSALPIAEFIAACNPEAIAELLADQDRLAAEVEAKWQPIETAPKDGTDVLGMYMHIDTQIVHNMFWMDRDDFFGDNPEGWWTYTHSECSRELLNDWRTPTHWMPLPATPEVKP